MKSFYLSLKYAHLPVKQNKRTQKLMMLYIKILYIVKQLLKFSAIIYINDACKS